MHIGLKVTTFVAIGVAVLDGCGGSNGSTEEPLDEGSASYRGVITSSAEGYNYAWEITIDGTRINGDSGVSASQIWSVDVDLLPGHEIVISTSNARSPECKIGKLTGQRHGATFADTVDTGISRCSYKRS